MSGTVLLFVLTGCGVPLVLEPRPAGPPIPVMSLPAIPEHAELTCDDITRTRCERQARQALHALEVDARLVTQIVVKCTAGCPNGAQTEGEVIVRHGREESVVFWSGTE